MDEMILTGMRVDIYNRCSTKEDTQTRALEVQAAESRELVIQLGGKIINQYVESESGTTTKARMQYQELLKDVEDGKIDCIVIKSIDRLMRNAGDWHLFIKKITTKNVSLYIYMEAKFYEPDDAFLAGIKALMAEQYSRELSIKINSAHKRRQATGRSLVLNGLVYGYRKDGTDYIIDEEEAFYIRSMYTLCAVGLGARRISERLYAEGMRGKQGNQISPTSIRRMIKNPIYYGTVVMNRTHFDFEKKKQIKNPPEKWIVHENRISPIVTRSLWDKANAAILGRTVKNRDIQKLNIDVDSKISNEHCITQKYDFSSKLFCAECNSPFYPRIVEKSDGSKTRKWCCGKMLSEGKQLAHDKETIIDKKGCTNIYIYEEELLQLIQYAFSEQQKKIISYEKEIEDKMLNYLQQVFTMADENNPLQILQKTRQRYERMKRNLLQKLGEEIITDQEYIEITGKITKSMEELDQRIIEYGESIRVKENVGERLKNISTQMRKQSMVKKVADDVILQNIQKIMVHRDGWLEIVYNGVEAHKIISYKHISLATLKCRNQMENIYQLLVRNEKMTTTQIAQEMELSCNNVLLKLHLLQEAGKVSYHSRGRIGGFWQITKKI